MEADYKVKLEVFEGPLDLLLYLIKQDEIDIYDISIERITRQYLEYLQAFKELNIELAGEFIVMAANLIYLKSRSLLPVDQQPPGEDADEDDPRWDLIRQLIEYEKIQGSGLGIASARTGTGAHFRARRRPSSKFAGIPSLGRGRNLSTDQRVPSGDQKDRSATGRAGDFRRTF